MFDHPRSDKPSLTWCSGSLRGDPLQTAACGRLEGAVLQFPPRVFDRSAVNRSGLLQPSDLIRRILPI